MLKSQGLPGCFLLNSVSSDLVSRSTNSAFLIYFNSKKNLKRAKWDKYYAVPGPDNPWRKIEHFKYE